MWRHRATLVAAACSALAAGMLVYVADRASAPPPLAAPFAWGGGVALFGPVGQWLPSFVHPFAFALLADAARPRAAAPAYGACLAWWMVNVLCEAGQHPRWRVLAGTFDPGDIACATLGALAAAAVMALAHRWEEPHGNRR